MLIHHRTGFAALPALGSATLLILLSTGCATKKWVQTKVVEPMDARIHGVDKKTDQNAQQIKDTDQRAEQGISEAKSEAENAGKQAADAQSQAQTAQTTAQKGVADAAAAKDFAKSYADNVDNYQPVKSQTVLFGFNKSALTDDDKQKLTELSQSLQGLKHYAIEVQGYTDATGSKQYNLELSQRRADAVVRYLTEDQKLPLAKIHVLGYGADDPVAPNRGAKNRKLNRRVEVKVMAAPGTESGAQTATTSSSQTPPAEPSPSPNAQQQAQTPQ